MSLNKQLIVGVFLALVLTGKLMPLLAQESDPVVQCTDAQKLFLDDEYDEALLLLDSIFPSQDISAFESPDELGVCYLILGYIRYVYGDLEGSIDANLAALEIFRQTSNLDLEQEALSAIGRVSNSLAGYYLDTGRFDEALSNYYRALNVAQDLGNRADEAIALVNIGEVYRSQGRYEEAEEAYQQALTVFRKLGSRANEAATLNNIGLLYEHQGLYDKVIPIYQQALQIMRELHDRAGEGITLDNLGIAYEKQGFFQEALTYHFQALDIMKEINDRNGEGITLNNIGEVYRSQGRYGLALDYTNQALIIEREVQNRAMEAISLSNLGAIYVNLGQFREGLGYLQEALAIQREVGDRAGEGTTLNNIGNIYSEFGQFGETLHVYQQALAIHQELGNKHLEGIIINNIGEVYLAQGRLDDALSLFGQSYQIMIDIGDLSGKATAQNNVGLSLARLGRYVESLNAYQQALEIEQEIGEIANQGVTLNNIGDLHLLQGDYKASINSYELALNTVREVGDVNQEGNTLSKLGHAYLEQGYYSQAQDLFDQALPILQGTGDSIGEIATLKGLGLVSQNLGNTNKALEYYDQALAILETVRAKAGSDIGRTSFISQYREIYDLSISLSLLDNIDEKNALLISEYGKARSFLDSLSSGSVELSDNGGEELFNNEQRSYERLITLKDAIARALSTNPINSELVTELELQLEEAETNYNETLNAIEVRQDQLASLVPGHNAVLYLSEIQSFLGERSTLISFWILENRTIAFIISNSNFNVVSINVPKTILNNQVQAFIDFTNTDSAYPETAITLYESLIEPLQPFLNTSHLIIVPHQTLHYVPFAALTDGERYLMDDFNITYLPNASMLQYLPSPEEQPVYETALILGNPAASSMDDFDIPLTDLPNIEQSSQTIAELFDTLPLLATEATEMAVRDKVSSANILHIGAHGRFNTIAPMQSAIYLTPGENETDLANNGRLQVDEVYGLPLENIELVVLSACETNLGFLDRDNPLNTISAGDEIVSLNRAFLFQSPTVISTLWTVDDAATSLLIERFYRYLLNGRSKADALRLAQMDVREDYPNPYYWAGFVLSGAGGKIDDTLVSESSTDILLQSETTAENNLEVSPSNLDTETRGDPKSRITPVAWLLLVGLILVIAGGFVIAKQRSNL